MSDFSALVAEFIGITACDASSAAACLRAHGNSLERAVSAYFDGWREDSTATATATAPDGGENDDEMRAPIAPRSEQLLTEHDLRFGPVGTARRTLALSGRAHGSPQRCVFDAFRNFRQEGASSRNDDEGGQNNDGSTAAAPSDSDDNSADDDESGGENTNTHTHTLFSQLSTTQQQPLGFTSSLHPCRNGSAHGKGEEAGAAVPSTDGPRGGRGL